MNDFAGRVLVWQRRYGRRDLPWQRSGDPYRIWLSEIMLQQTQVATVLPYYARFVAEFPTVHALAQAPISRVLAQWSGLGYYRRAHHLHAAARIVVGRHAGRVPSDATTLATLPGIGRSTAAAIAAFASGERRPILDGNVKRVLARHRGIDGWPGAPKIAAALWEAAEALLPSETDCARDTSTIADYTQGMMDLGATICTRARPRCDRCPVNDDCIARREHRVDALPAPRPRKPLPKRAVVVLLLERDRAVLLEQRPPVGIWAGLWSFPELPVDGDVGAHLMSRFGVVADMFERLPALTHVFTHFALTMHPVRVRVDGMPPKTATPAIGWFTRAAALAAPIPAPVRRLLSLPVSTGRSADADASTPVML